MDRSIMEPHRFVIASLVVAFAIAPAGALAAGEQAEQFTPEYRQLHTTFDAKHSPKITAPDSVKRGEWFDVTVSVGAGGQHPSLSEHSIRSIALDEGGSLRALAEPNHSAAWEVSKKIDVTP